MKKTNWPYIILFILLFTSAIGKAQPYIDIIQVRYLHGLAKSYPGASNPTHLWIGSDLPIRFKNKSILLVSPTYESWELGTDGSYEALPSVSSFALPVGYIKPIAESKWTITVLPIVRWNGEKLFGENTFQFGGVAFAGFTTKPGKQFRAGVYLNDEFFGLFVIPLFGVDWRLDDKNYLFGMLPGRLTFEHQFGQRLYGGFSFRAPSNSYRLESGLFVRVNDHQVSAYLDYYVGKHICFTVEPGFAVFRKLRLGFQDKNYIRELNWQDNPFIKLNASYRIRLDDK
jgi:hypothetical protein